MLKRSQSEAPARVLRARSAATTLAIVAALGLGGCAGVPDWANPVEWYDGVFGDSVPPPPGQTAAVPGAEEPFPTLSSVPERPEPPGTPQQRQAVAEGLVADRAQARYTDEVLRSVPPPPAPALAPAPVPAPVPTQAPAPPATTPVLQPRIVAQPAPPPLAPYPPLFPASPYPQPSPAAPYPQLSPAAPYPQLSPAAPQPAPYSPQAAPQPAPYSPQAAPLPPPVQTPLAPPAQAVPLPTGVTPAATTDQQTLVQTYAASLAASAATVVTTPVHGGFEAAGAQPLSPQSVPVLEVLRDNYNESLSRKPASIPQVSGAATAPLTPVAAPPPLARGVAVAGTAVGSVKFGNGSTALSAASRRTIKRLAERHKERGGVIRIVGHASERTKDLPMATHNLVNFRLSADRAQAVASELMRRGVPARAIIVEARSANDPIYYEWMPKGEAENRRVDIFFES